MDRGLDQVLLVLVFGLDVHRSFLDPRVGQPDLNPPKVAFSLSSDLVTMVTKFGQSLHERHAGGQARHSQNGRDTDQEHRK